MSLTQPDPKPADVLVIIAPLQSLNNSIIGAMSLHDMVTVFRRALNTWGNPPEYLIEASDQLETLYKRLHEPVH